MGIRRFERSRTCIRRLHERACRTGWYCVRQSESGERRTPHNSISSVPSAINMRAFLDILGDFGLDYRRCDGIVTSSQSMFRILLGRGQTSGAFSDWQAPVHELHQEKIGSTCASFTKLKRCLIPQIMVCVNVIEHHRVHAPQYDDGIKQFHHSSLSSTCPASPTLASSVSCFSLYIVG